MQMIAREIRGHRADLVMLQVYDGSIYICIYCFVLILRSPAAVAEGIGVASC